MSVILVSKLLILKHDLPEHAIGSKRLNTAGNLLMSGIVLDTLFFITGLVVGILGLISVGNITPAQAYSGLGLSGFIGLSVLGLTVYSKGKFLVLCKDILQTACCCKHSDKV